MCACVCVRVCVCVCKCMLVYTFLSAERSLGMFMSKPICLHRGKATTLSLHAVSPSLCLTHTHTHILNTRAHTHTHTHTCTSVHFPPLELLASSDRTSSFVLIGPPRDKECKKIGKPSESKKEKIKKEKRTGKKKEAGLLPITAGTDLYFKCVPVLSPLSSPCVVGGHCVNSSLKNKWLPKSL